MKVSDNYVNKVNIEMDIHSDVKKWILGIGYYKNNEDEYEKVAKHFVHSSRKMWTAKFSENLVKYLLERTGYIVNEQPLVDTCRLDLETNRAYYEVKGRNYTTLGTVGQKILGTPYLYINLKRSKPIYIVLVGYQEYEGEYKFNLFSARGEQSNLLQIYKSHKIQYIQCSQLLHQAYFTYVFKELKEKLNLKE